MKYTVTVKFDREFNFKAVLFAFDASAKILSQTVPETFEIETSLGIADLASLTSVLKVEEKSTPKLEVPTSMLLYTLLHVMKGKYDDPIYPNNAKDIKVEVQEITSSGDLLFTYGGYAVFDPIIGVILKRETSVYQPNFSVTDFVLGAWDYTKGIDERLQMPLIFEGTYGSRDPIIAAEFRTGPTRPENVMVLQYKKIFE